MASPRAGTAATLVAALYVDGSLTGMTDEQLLERFVSQRGEAAELVFSALVQRHGPMVLSVCRSTPCDHHDAEDAFQATFLVLARKAPSLRTPGRLGPWLHGVARRSTQKICARKARFERLMQRAETSPRPAATLEPDHDFDRQEETTMLHEEIGRLPERYRSPVVLCYLEGRTQEEAAAMLGWPLGTVGVRLMRARERLRAGLSRRGMAPSMTVLPPLGSLCEPPTSLLAMQTARAAVSFAAKNGPAIMAIRAPIVETALEILRTMVIKKVAAAVATILIVGMLAGGTVLAFQPPAAAKKTAGPPASTKAARGAEKAPSILANGGFEEGNAKNPSPDGWQRGAKLAGVEYHWDRDVAHQGKASLHLRKTAQRYFPIAQWFQEVRRTGTTSRLKVTAFVKAKNVTKAILDVQFADQNGADSHKWAVYVGAKENGDPPVTHNWQKYEGIVEIPTGTRTMIVALQIYGPGDVWVDDITADYTEQQATDPVAASLPAVPSPRPDADVADVPLQERTAANDPRKRYLLIGPSGAPAAPESGYRLLVVLPGGDGGAGFQTFARRIARNALPPGYLLAQLVAVSWTPEQAAQIVWPTAADKSAQIAFTTDAFIADVIDDVSRSHKIDPRFIFAFGWSSGGPPVYASSLTPATRVTGWFVAMSVFKPERLPPLTCAKGRAYYVYHSPDDQLCSYTMAEEAAQSLQSNGATVRLARYEGGHGWSGPVYDDIRVGIEWLERRLADE
jgi:RNA polymerase sigma factor (sigma-70 family)